MQEFLEPHSGIHDSSAWQVFVFYSRGIALSRGFQPPQNPSTNFERFTNPGDVL